MGFSGGRDRDVSQQSDPVLLLAAEPFGAETLRNRQGRFRIDRHRVTQTHSAGLDQPEASGEFGALDQAARREQIEMISKSVPCEKFELRLTVELSLDVLDLSQDTTVGIDSAGSEIPGLEFGEQSRTRTTQVGFVRFHALFLDLTATFFEVFASLEQPLLIRVVTQEVGAGLFAFDDHGTTARNAAFAFSNSEQGTGAVHAFVLTFEPTGDIDSPTGDRAADFGRHCGASQPSQPLDRELLQFKMFDGLAGHDSPPCDPKYLEVQGLFVRAISPWIRDGLRSSRLGWQVRP